VTDTLLLLAVVVAVLAETNPLAGFNEGVPDRCCEHWIGNIQFTVTAMNSFINFVELLVALGLDKLGQHLIIRPTIVPIPSPIVVVRPIASHISHRVGRTATTHRFSAR
jgi:hypothetical protein